MATPSRVSLLAQPPQFASSRLRRHGAAAPRLKAAVRPAGAKTTLSFVGVRWPISSLPGPVYCSSVSYGRHQIDVVPLETFPAFFSRCGIGSAEADAAVPRSVPVRVAYELQQAGHRYLDVRSEGEFSGGHPEGAVNIPYMYKTGSGMTKNTHFLEQVSMVFGKDEEIIVGCQSGKRSLMAATELCSAGFTALTDIAGGFSSWKESGLPVNQ